MYESMSIGGYLIPLVLGLLGLILATRVTDRAIRQRFKVSESSANTYAQEEISFPVAVLAGGKVQAVEMMDVTYELEFPDSEDGQFNRVRAQFVRDSQTGIAAWDSDQCIFRFAEDTDSGAINPDVYKTHPHQVELGPLNNPDEGFIILERSIFVGIQGVGNSGAKTFSGYFDYHIVELEPAEIAVQLFADDA